MHRQNSQKKSLLDHVAVLAIMGLLAGAVGGLGVGIVMQHSASAVSSTTSSPSPSK
jgi:hypothetical protein